MMSHMAAAPQSTLLSTANPTGPPSLAKARQSLRAPCVFSTFAFRLASRTSLSVRPVTLPLPNHKLIYHRLDVV
jgi:hypothetical protein